MRLEREGIYLIEMQDTESGTLGALLQTSRVMIFAERSERRGSMSNGLQRMAAVGRMGTIHGHAPFNYMDMWRLR